LEGAGGGVVLHDLAGLAAADVLVGDQQVALSVEDQAAGAIEAVAARDELPLAGAAGGVEPLHAVVGALAVTGVVADEEGVGGGRRDGALLQRLQRESGAARPRACGPGGE